MTAPKATGQKGRKAAQKQGRKTPGTLGKGRTAGTVPEGRDAAETIAYGHRVMTADWQAERPEDIEHSIRHLSRQARRKIRPALSALVDALTFRPEAVEGTGRFAEIVKEDNRLASFALAQEAVLAIEQLVSVLGSLPAPAQRAAAESIATWPVMLGPQLEAQRTAAAHVKALGLGKRHGFKITGRKTPSQGTPINAAAAHYVGVVSAYRGEAAADSAGMEELRSLPPFGRKTAAAWARAAWNILLADYGGHPERNPALRRLGEHRARHTEYMATQKRVTPATAEANIRDGIKTAFSLAVKRLAG